MLINGSFPASAAPLLTYTVSPLQQPLSQALPLDQARLNGDAQNAPDATQSPPTCRAPRRASRNIKKRENALREILERNGQRLVKLGKDRYQIFSERLNAVCCLFDCVPLKAVERHFEETWAEKPSGSSYSL